MEACLRQQPIIAAAPLNGPILESSRTFAAEKNAKVDACAILVCYSGGQATFGCSLLNSEGYSIASNVMTETQHLRWLLRRTAGLIAKADDCMN